ncbi:hypothetical protein TD95_003802 [Thielaviopsis punctulata]|uniref:Cut9 interacting protein Scn1 n=1 Tax=Thielaviopsis punctulata TaxID=72032 RepID=A0A0F4ZBK7_9PEZI|nr:hypothetical protein TD95_003802 [Thielaviopsis punctulata]
MCGSIPHSPSAPAVNSPSPFADSAAAAADDDDNSTRTSHLPMPGPLFDAHCHPTDHMHATALIPHMHAAQLIAMATRAQDQILVARLAAAQPQRVVPAFGWHPWFSHLLLDDLLASESESGSVSAADKDAHYIRVLDLKSPLTPADRAFIADLPAPTPLSSFLAQTEALLRQHPHALVGEVGLDRAFRLPVHPSPSPLPPSSSTPPAHDAPTPGTRLARRLSPYRVSPTHQIRLLTAHLRLAAAYRRPVSIHGVQAHGLLYETLSSMWRGWEHELPNRRQRRQRQRQDDLFDSDSETLATADTDAKETPFPPKICLHSFSGPKDFALRYTHASVPCKVFFSFSSAVNLGGTAFNAPPLGTPPLPNAAAAQKFTAVVAALPADRILAESDLDAAGPRMDFELQRVYRAICDVRGWTLDQGVQQIKQNYQDFIRVEALTKA